MAVTVEKKTISFCMYNDNARFIFYGWPKIMTKWPKLGFYLKRENVVCPLTLSNKKPKRLYISVLVDWSFWKNWKKKKKKDWEQSMTANIWKSERFLRTNSAIHVFLLAKSQDLNINFHIPNHLQSSHKKKEMWNLK